MDYLILLGHPGRCGRPLAGAYGNEDLFGYQVLEKKLMLAPTMSVRGIELALTQGGPRLVRKNVVQVRPCGI